MLFCNARLPLLAGLASLALFIHLPAGADEGMWLYNQPPRKLVLDKYSFELTDSWLEHLQKSSVRFGNGGSAEFVSKDGLLLSNHHVGSSAIQKLSTAEHNYIHDGFYARTPAEEKPCQGLEVKVLMSIEDVTSRVNAAVKPDSTADDAFKQRRAVIAEIEKECLDRTGYEGEVVTLYQGALYHLYRFKKYSDVRLVFAPEETIAFFGGDPDNFEYPRFNLDISLFRVYENGTPAHIDHFLKWSPNGPRDSELVFVSGHPGRTDRLRTVAELEFMRDSEYPRTLERLKRIEVSLGAYGARSAENARRARGDLFSAQNARKVRDGMLEGLLDPEFMASKRKAESELRSAMASRPELKEAEGAWTRIAAAQKTIAQHAVEYDMLERGWGFNSPLFTYARNLLRAAEEHAKPNPDRLEEFQEAGRKSFEHALFAEQPIYPDLETIKLADSLTWLAEQLGYTHPVVQKVLAGSSPHKRADMLVRGTKLATAKVRTDIYAGGSSAIDKTADPMIELARLVDTDARAVRSLLEPQREAIRQAHSAIGKARFAVRGTSDYPDATSSLRLAFGTVKGYEEAGHHVPFQTTFAGLYERAADHQDVAPFDLPSSWVSKKSKLKLETPFNFVCTADIIGGNSGSPVVNRQGELVGIIFDGNIQSLTANLGYTEEQCRAVAVHSTSIIEALQKVYDAQPLADELTGKKPVSP